MAKQIKITEAQMTALVTAGVFEDDEMAELASAISGNCLTVSDSTARMICDLSNDADELSREFSDERGAWYRNDSRVLANLYSKALRV